MTQPADIRASDALEPKQDLGSSTSAETIQASGLNDPAATGPLSMRLHRDRAGPVIAVEPVTARDLIDPLAELWFETDLRAGRPTLGLGEMTARVRTVEREDPEIGRYCAGFELMRESTHESASAPTRTQAQGANATLFFPRESLEHIASRAARKLVSRGELEAGDRYFYALERGAFPDAVVNGPEGRSAPDFAPLPLHALRERAEAIDILAGDTDFPVFFTREARERAERISRKGGDVNPPVETGCLLLGMLCCCPETGEIFAVVLDVIEATDAEATKYSLTYSGPTWSRIQTVLRARRRQPATRHHRILGQCHGHNFLPFEGAEPCEACAIVEVCTRSSAHLSPDDRTWTRAVFSAEPWQLSQVFGLDARSHLRETFYGQRGGALMRRGYYIIDAFEQAQGVK